MPIANKKRRPTIADVAKLAGVSNMAVSSVLNKGKGKTTYICEKTATLIHAAAKQLGYQTNLTAQSLVTGKTGFIGFMLASSVSHGFKNIFFSSYFQGAEQECRRLGYGLAATCAPITEAGKFIQSNILSQRRIDALIVAGEIDSQVYKELEISGIPFIVLNAIPSKALPTIGTPSQNDIFRYIAKSGHKRAIITTNAGTNTADLAEIELMAEKICPEVEIEFLMPASDQHPNWEPDFGLGRHLFERWMAKPEGKRATIIQSNGVLPEFYGELLKAGMKCPDEVSLLGENTLDTCAFPKFTRICGANEAVAADAVSLLVSAVETGTPLDIEACKRKEYRSILIPGETVKEIRQ